LLKDLLKDVGIFIKADDVTLNLVKGRFARVFLNIDITRPLRRSLFIQSLGKVTCLKFLSPMKDFMRYVLFVVAQLITLFLVPTYREVLLKPLLKSLKLLGFSLLIILGNKVRILIRVLSQLKSES